MTSRRVGWMRVEVSPADPADTSRLLLLGSEEPETPETPANVLPMKRRGKRPRAKVNE